MIGVNRIVSAADAYLYDTRGHVDCGPKREQERNRSVVLSRARPPDAS